MQPLVHIVTKQLRVSRYSLKAAVCQSGCGSLYRDAVDNETNAASEADIERLVEEVVKRVQARIGAAPATPGSPAAVTGGRSRLCQQPGTSACDSCQGCHVRRPTAVRSILRAGAERIAAGPGNDAPDRDLAGMIDHTLLKPDATREQIRTLCDEAKRYGFATVCVNAAHVRTAATLLEGSSVKAIAVVGFPLGAGTGSAKAFEAREAVRHGAQEIDMVIAIGALKSKDYAAVVDDIRAVVAAVAPKPVKVIIETGALNRDEKVIACALAKVGGAAFVKTSTGFGPGGATVDDVRLMREVVGAEMGVKASGGVHTREEAQQLIEAGATRIGASASVAIVTEEKNQDTQRISMRGRHRPFGGNR
jgi:deoxyribose-phosphate aldolase